MRIVDEDFLREVQGADEAALEIPDTADDGKGANLDTDKSPTEHHDTIQMSAIREAFDVSDEEVEQILHDETLGGSPTRFVPNSLDDAVAESLPGSAPFLARDEPRQHVPTEAAAFTKGTSISPSAQAQPSSASDIVHAQLIVLDGSRHYRLPLSGDRTSWTIGSAADADIRIAQTAVAADHAIILMEGTSWTLCDRGTQGGCAVNGHEVNVARIQPGDRLNIGSAECLFTEAENELPPSPPRAREAHREADPFGDDPMDSPRMRVEIPMDDSIWDEHEQQLYRDTSRDRILRERSGSSRHLPESDSSPIPRRPPHAARVDPLADYGRPSGLARFLPSTRTLVAIVLVAVALGILGTLAFFVL